MFSFKEKKAKRKRRKRQAYQQFIVVQCFIVNNTSWRSFEMMQTLTAQSFVCISWKINKLCSGRCYRYLPYQLRILGFSSSFRISSKWVSVTDKWKAFTATRHSSSLLEVHHEFNCAKKVNRRVSICITIRRLLHWMRFLLSSSSFSHRFLLLSLNSNWCKSRRDVQWKMPANVRKAKAQHVKTNAMWLIPEWNGIRSWNSRYTDDVQLSLYIKTDNELKHRKPRSRQSLIGSLTSFFLLNLYRSVYGSFTFTSNDPTTSVSSDSLVMVIVKIPSRVFAIIFRYFWATHKI